MSIKDMREKLGMSQKEFGSMFRVSYRTIQSWEQGLRKTPEYITYMMERIIEPELVFSLIESPIETGSTVYGFTYPRTDIIAVSPERVEAIKITNAGIEIETDTDCYLLSDFGKRLFFTEDAAMEALKTRQP